MNKKEIRSSAIQTLSEEDRKTLLVLARQAMEEAVRGERPKPLDLSKVSETLRSPGASFVTLTKFGQLRGCIGALEAYQPLAEDVREHAIAAALHDFRFSPVQPYELGDIHIEISRIMPSEDLEYTSAEDLLSKLVPHKHGVILQDGVLRATFLPQVWEKLPRAEDFLSHLCQKMGVSPDAWRYKKLKVKIYEVEEFHEVEV